MCPRGRPRSQGRPRELHPWKSNLSEQPKQFEQRDSQKKNLSLSR